MNNKILAKTESHLFFSLWLGLLDHVNKKYQVNPGLPEISPAVRLPGNEIIKVSDQLWKNPNEIDIYLSGNSQLPQEHREIIHSWNHFISGNFIVERHLKNGSIFISSETMDVYLVKGITDPWEFLLRKEPLPIILQATLIPFRDAIITDGLIRPYDVTFGKGMKQELEDIYNTAKRSSKIIRSFDYHDSDSEW